MHFIFGNYGNNTIALIQWVKEQQLSNVFVIHIETGWSSPDWDSHVGKAIALAKTYHFETITLRPQKSFPELIKDRKSFPSKKYQWCTSFLKALTFLTWADEIDPSCEALILLGSRRADSRVRASLSEYIYNSEHYNQRTVWYPLYLHSDEERNELIERCGFTVLQHRSYECQPCIHSPITELSQLTQERVQQIAVLEKLCQQSMLVENEHKEEFRLEFFDMGCGSHYVCGE